MERQLKMKIQVYKIQVENWNNLLDKQLLSNFVNNFEARNLKDSHIRRDTKFLTVSFSFNSIKPL